MTNTPTVSGEVSATILLGHPDNREYFKVSISLHGVDVDADLQELRADARPTIDGIVRVLCDKLDDVVEGNVGRRPTQELGAGSKPVPGSGAKKKTEDAIPVKKRSGR